KGIEARKQTTWPLEWRMFMAELNPADSAWDCYEATGEWLLWQPELTFVWSYCGTFARSVGLPREAMKMFEAALPLERTDLGKAELELQWGETLRRMGSNEQAVKHLRSALEHDARAEPEAVFVWHEFPLALALIDSGDPQAGLEIVRKLESVAGF